jgi:hypothetical protein
VADFRYRAGEFGQRADHHAAIGNRQQPAGVDLKVDDWKDTCAANGCNYLNTAGFVRVPVVSATNATVRPGNYLPGMVRGPGEFNLHTTFAKSFNLARGTRLQVRAEAFNLLNWKNYSNPNTNMNSGDFGRITGAGRPRVIQLGARYTF